MSIDVPSTSTPSQDVSEEVSGSVGVARKSVKITKYINQIQWSIEMNRNFITPLQYVTVISASFWDINQEKLNAK